MTLSLSQSSTFYPKQNFSKKPATRPKLDYLIPNYTRNEGQTVKTVQEAHATVWTELRIP
jgi:hypothetical protein